MDHCGARELIPMIHRNHASHCTLCAGRSLAARNSSRHLRRHTRRAHSHTCKLFWPYTARIRRAFLNANWTKLYLALRRRLLSANLFMMEFGILSSRRGLCIKFCTRSARESENCFEGKLSSSLVGIRRTAGAVTIRPDETISASYNANALNFMWEDLAALLEFLCLRLICSGKRSL